MAIEIATFGAGCFWCVEKAFNHLKGVSLAVSGYAGGSIANPSYESVSSGTTGHAEVVQIRFDNEQTSFEQLLTVFFSLHNPTELNRQGNDIGSQYRSIIFYHSEQQRSIANQMIEYLKKEKRFDAPIVTLVEPEATFYPAEDYHQDFVTQNPRNPYCLMIVTPKLEKFKKKFATCLKK